MAIARTRSADRRTENLKLISLSYTVTKDPFARPNPYLSFLIISCIRKKQNRERTFGHSTHPISGLELNILCSVSFGRRGTKISVPGSISWCPDKGLLTIHYRSVPAGHGSLKNLGVRPKISVPRAPIISSLAIWCRSNFYLHINLYIHVHVHVSLITLFRGCP